MQDDAPDEEAEACLGADGPPASRESPECSSTDLRTSSEAASGEEGASGGGDGPRARSSTPTPLPVNTGTGVFIFKDF